MVECVAWAPDSAQTPINEAVTADANAPNNLAASDAARTGPFLISGSRDKTIKFWDISTGERKRQRQRDRDGETSEIRFGR